MHSVIRRCASRPYLARLSSAGRGGVCGLVQLHHTRCSVLRPHTRNQPLGTRNFTSRVLEENSAEEELQLEDDGEYEVIVPKDPYAMPEIPPPRPVPSHILRPPYATPASIQLYEDTGHFVESYIGDGRIILGGEEEKRLRRAAAFARRVLNMAGTLAVKGVTTDAIDARVHDYIIANGAYPSPLHYSGFPKSCCTSVNNVVVHGIPDARPLRDGDIVNIDITVYLDGYHGDTSKTFLVGNVDKIGRDLVQITEAAVEAGIRVCKPGQPLQQIAKAIHEVLKDKDYTVCPGFTGHGIGTVFHQPPYICHDRNGEPGVMLPGHCFTIEPAIIKGSNGDFMTFGDNWTTSSTNWARAAQAEHMVLITETGADVLTQD